MILILSLFLKAAIHSSIGQWELELSKNFCFNNVFREADANSSIVERNAIKIYILYNYKFSSTPLYQSGVQTCKTQVSDFNEMPNRMEECHSNHFCHTYLTCVLGRTDKHQLYIHFCKDFCIFFVRYKNLQNNFKIRRFFDAVSDKSNKTSKSVKI